MPAPALLHSSPVCYLPGRVQRPSADLCSGARHLGALQHLSLVQRVVQDSPRATRWCRCHSAAVAEPPASGVRERVPSLPFVRLAGQEDMKLALLLNVVDQTIGGVLIMGDRGTGKSVAVSTWLYGLPPVLSPACCRSCVLLAGESPG